MGAVGDDSHGGAVGVGAEAGDARRDAMAVTDSPPGGDSGDRGTGAGDGAREDGVDGSADTNGNGDSDGVGASGGTDHRGGTDVSSGTHYSAGADASQGTDYNDGTGASGDGGDSGGVDASGYGEGTGVIGGADHSGGTDYSGGTDASGGTDYNGGTGASGDSERVGASGGTDRSGGTDGTDGTDGAGGSGGTDGTDGAGGNGGAGGVVGGVQAGGRSGIAGRGGPRLEWVLDDLAARGVRTLLVEGGAAVHTQFLVAGLADELRLAVAPVVVGDSRAPRFLSDGAFPRPLELAEARRLGDVAVLRYRAAAEPSSQDVRWLRQAIELADRCPPSSTFRVGAVVGLPDGTVLATGHSGEGDPRNHAEEAALAKLSPDDPRLAEATIYSSLEPCSARASHPKSCTQLILETPIPRVVTAWREPVLFVDAEGVEQLTAAGRQVLEIPALAADVRRANTHLRGVRP
ncbi:dihydrofolate reductase family protein [Amycolatopsis jiangsuensis]|uniref:dihydrofolate reductase family protein n=1 Tax=Amycolatopsis jiangsuensis TaxID=1181879 RepID=UPI0035E458FD